jgi:HK97 gp10 family phage protein
MSNVKVKLQPNASKILSTYLHAFTWKSADNIKKEAKLNCPVDTGKLKRSIKVVKDGNIYKIGSQLSYALFVEVGTRYMTARAFLRNAFYSVVRKKL